MTHPFRRSAAAQHRPALRPAPGTPSYEVEGEGGFAWDDEDDDSDWATWEDSVQPPDPIEKAGRRSG